MDRWNGSLMDKWMDRKKMDRWNDILMDKWMDETDHLNYIFNTQSPFRRHKERVSREEVERRIKEDNVVFNDKFSDDAKLICTQV